MTGPAWRCPTAPLDVVVVVAMLTLIAASRPATQTVTEPALKAAFLNNFAKFTEWPSDALGPRAPLTLCVVSDRAVSDSLRGLTAGTVLDGHALVVLFTATAESLPLDTCRLLYLSGVDQKQTAALLTAVRSQPILTVSDFSKFAQNGGIVQLIVERGAVKFAVNLAAAQRARLRLSSKILSWARFVEEDPYAIRH